MKKNSFLLIVFILMGFLQQVNAAQFQSPASIQEAVRHFINKNLILNAEYTLKVGQLDSRLQLPLCSKELKVFAHNGSLKPGRNSIRVKCQSVKKWTIYTSATIKAYKKVITLTQPVRRGEIFNPAILQFEKRDISTLRAGFITNKTIIAGKQATKNLGLGAVINGSHLTEPKLIKRGDKVTIKASNANFQISVAGLAMMDGIKNQNIKVKNLTSKQMIQATVVKKGLVEVTF